MSICFKAEKITNFALKKTGEISLHALRETKGSVAIPGAV